MSNLLFQTGFWTHGNFLQDAAAGGSRDTMPFVARNSLDNANSKIRINEESNGLLNLIGTNPRYQRAYISSINASDHAGETYLYDGVGYRGAGLCLNSGEYVTVDNTVLNTTLGSTNGIELHFNWYCINLTSPDPTLVCIYDGVTYRINPYCNSSYNLAFVTSGSPNTNLLTGSLTDDSSINYSWCEFKIRAFVHNNTLYVKIYRRHGANICFGYFSTPYTSSGSNSITGIKFGSSYSNRFAGIDNLSIYRVNAADAASYSLTNTINDFDAFQRVIFAFMDYWNITGGTDWVGSNAGISDVFDGSDLTYAKATTNPLGLSLASGTLGDYINKFFTRTLSDSGIPLAKTSSITGVSAFLHKVSESSTETWTANVTNATPVNKTVLGAVSDFGVPIVIPISNEISSSSTTVDLTVKLA